MKDGEDVFVNGVMAPEAAVPDPPANPDAAKPLPPAVPPLLTMTVEKTISVEDTEVIVAGEFEAGVEVITPDAAVEIAPEPPPVAKPLPPADPYVLVYTVENCVEYINDEE